MLLATLNKSKSTYITHDLRYHFIFLTNVMVSLIQILRLVDGNHFNTFQIKLYRLEFKRVQKLFREKRTVDNVIFARRVRKTKNTKSSLSDHEAKYCNKWTVGLAEILFLLRIPLVFRTSILKKTATV